MVEAWGRRKLLLFGAIGMALSQFIVAGVGTGAGIANLAAQKALIAFVCIYIFFFACSWGPCAWVSKASPLHHKNAKDANMILPLRSSQAKSSPSKSAPNPSP